MIRKILYLGILGEALFCIAMISKLNGDPLTSYFYRIQYELTKPKNSTSQALPTSQPTLTPTPAPPRKVEFLKVDNKAYFQYKKNIYTEGTEDGVFKTNRPQDKNAHWITILEDTPPAKGDLNFYDEIFDARLAPSEEQLFFVMNIDGYYVYQYDFKTSTRRELLIQYLKNKDEKVYKVPRIHSISPDSKYIAFNMYGCWYCGGHVPQILLMRITDNQTKYLGKTTHFKWNNDGNYEYKDYIEKPCPPDSYPVCFTQPEELPLKAGQF